MTAKAERTPATTKNGADGINDNGAAPAFSRHSGATCEVARPRPRPAGLPNGWGALFPSALVRRREQDIP